MPNPWLILAVIAALGGAWGHGYQRGKASLRADLMAAQARAHEAAAAADAVVRRIESARLVAEAARDVLAREIEDETFAAPDADLPAFGADGMRRLNRIRRQGSPAP